MSIELLDSDTSILFRSDACAQNVDRDMLAAVFARVILHVPQAKTITIHASDRRPTDARSDPGWLEWIIVYEYRDGGKLTVGAIQRTPGADYEFHS